MLNADLYYRSTGSARAACTKPHAVLLPGLAKLSWVSSLVSILPWVRTLRCRGWLNWKAIARWAPMPIGTGEKTQFQTSPAINF